MKRNEKGQFLKVESDNNYKGNKIFYDSKGYPLVHINGRDIKVHILVWEEVNGKKPIGCNIHHKDFNKANYKIDNLELLSESSHRRIHSGWVMNEGKWIAKPCSFCKRTLPLEAFWNRRTAKTPSAKCKECNWKYLKQLKRGEC